MEKIDGLSMDMNKMELDKLATVFPECFVEGKLVLGKLLALLGKYDTKDFERYELTWKGKSECLPLAQKRSTGTLRPCPEESVDFGATDNLYIEGDNLEVLKLLQTPYYRQVKMIYIDPPYNTGNDFVYEDDFADTLARYKEVTGQATRSNPESMGRFHTNWLNMMYPRLRLAANLLRDDGVIFISIDDGELANVKKMCDEIFGEENFVAMFLWKKKSTTSNVRSAEVSPQADYQICYRKSAAFRLRQRVKPASERTYPGHDGEGRYRTAVIEKKDAGSYRRESMKFAILGHVPREGKRWQIGEKLARELEAKNRFLWDGEKVVIKIYDFEDRDTQSAQPTILDNHGTSEGAAYALNQEMFDTPELFDNPKPVELLEHCIAISTNTGSGDIVLDFFSGSATTAHAVMQLNAKDGGNRRFILVQLPERCEEKSEACKAGYKNICEIGKERIRRAGKKTQAGMHKLDSGKMDQFRLDGGPKGCINSSLDTGFKVFKLDTSNLKTWDSSPIADDNLLSYVDRFNSMIDLVKADRTDLDMVYEIMLKMGIPLTEPVTQISIAGKNAYSVGEDCLLLICLTIGLTVEAIEEMAEYAPEKIVIAESSLADDSAMANAHYILRDRGIELKLV